MTRNVSHARVIVANKGAFFAVLKQTRAWGYHYIQTLNAMNSIPAKRFLIDEDLNELFEKANPQLESINALRANVDDTIMSILETYATPIIERSRDEKNNRSTRVTVHLSDSENEALDANAKFLGCTRSEYLRALNLIPLELLVPDETGFLIDAIVADKVLLPEIASQTHAFGYRFNAALHALNTINAKKFMSQEDTYDLFSDAIESLSEIETYEPKISSLIDELKKTHIMNLDGRYRW